MSVTVSAAPDHEDPTLPPEIPQRLSWRYNVEFDASDDAFAGFEAGDVHDVELRVTTSDRAGNATTATAPVRLSVDPNPYLIDGDVPWRSIDTRVFHLLEGTEQLGETYTPGRDPLELLRAFLARLNGSTTGTEAFDDLPIDGVSSALEYAESVPNPSTGASLPVQNFVIAKVRIATQGGANNVRAFFRLFRYAAPTLLFDEASSYRTHNDGAGKKISLMGYESSTAGAAISSIPVFGTARVPIGGTAMNEQTDPGNVHSFTGAEGAEQVWYFGAWLDVNQSSAQLPGSYAPATPEGPFPLAATHTIRSLLIDFHQCLVAEIRYDGDPTAPGASPFDSENLAQRNLVVLQSDNPGDLWTRTAEHSFELDLRRLQRDPKHADGTHVPLAAGGALCPGCGHRGFDDAGVCVSCGGAATHPPLRPEDSREILSSPAFEAQVMEEAMSLAMLDPKGARLMIEGNHDAAFKIFAGAATANVLERTPLVAHPYRWLSTTHLFDELAIRWNDLPEGSIAELFLPGMDAAEIVSLRNLRHAPATVWATEPSTLGLAPGGTTYLPVPPVNGERQAGVLTIKLPDGVKAGSKYTVVVSHLRAGSTTCDGAFEVHILIGHADTLLARVGRGVALLDEQLRGRSVGDRWQPVLAKRLATERHKAIGLAAELGIAWQDPTVWSGDDGLAHPVRGERVRVVLESITVLDDRDPWPKGAGEFDLAISVASNNNGGQLQEVRFPDAGRLSLRSGETAALEQEVFVGIVHDHLGLQVTLMERDTFDPDDLLGVYTRVFQCDPQGWLGHYAPGEMPLDPQSLGYWQLRYRIERA